VDPIIHLLTNSKLVLRGLRRLYCNDLLNLPKNPTCYGSSANLQNKPVEKLCQKK
jgi:hypothetical protein